MDKEKSSELPQSGHLFKADQQGSKVTVFPMERSLEGLESHL